MVARLLLGLLVFWMAGCAQFGSHTVSPAQFNYNAAILRGWNEQLLLNLVRLRYGESPLFLEVSNVVTGYTFSGNVGSNAAFTTDAGGFDNSLKGSAGLSYTERPTITYSPLQGENFTRRVMRPIPAEMIVLLADAGWSMKSILLCCVQEINGLRNAPPAPGAGAYHSDEFAVFQRLADLIDQLQRQGQFSIRLGRSTADTPSLVINESRGMGETAREVRSLLQLPLDEPVFPLSDGRVFTPGEVMLAGRSLIGTLQFLSQGVEAPRAHADEVYQVRDVQGRVRDPSEWMGELIRVHASRLKPNRAFVSVAYRDHWFWIDRRDLHSKTTLGLLNQLFSLQTVGEKTGNPILTIPTG